MTHHSDGQSMNGAFEAVSCIGGLQYNNEHVDVFQTREVDLFVLAATPYRTSHACYPAVLYDSYLIRSHFLLD